MANVNCFNELHIYSAWKLIFYMSCTELQLFCVCLVLSMHIFKGVNCRSLAKSQHKDDNISRRYNSYDDADADDDNDDDVDSSKSGEYLHISCVGNLHLHLKQNIPNSRVHAFPLNICNFLIISCLFWSASLETEATTTQLKTAIRKIDSESWPRRDTKPITKTTSTQERTEEKTPTQQRQATKLCSPIRCIRGGLCGFRCCDWTKRCIFLACQLFTGLKNVN